MADSKRQAAACVVDDDVAHRIHEYEKYSKRTCSHSERLQHAVKCMNNYVKACVLDCAVRTQEDTTLHVADVACGRGQDFAKWNYAARGAGKRFGVFYTADQITVDTTDMLRKYIHAEKVIVRVCDVTERFVDCETASIDVLSCQLAVNYMLKTEVMIHGFFSECGRVLKETGILLLSYADGRSIVRRGRDALRRRPSEEYAVTVASTYHSLTIPSTILENNLQFPYGNKYTISVHGCIDSIPEFLCHEGILQHVASKYGFRGGASMFFDEAVQMLQRIPHYYTIGVLMKAFDLNNVDALSVASLYRFSVYSKTQDVLKTFGSLWTTGTSATHRLSS